MKESRFLIYIVFVAFSVRFLFFLLFNHETTNYWEYGIIAKNLFQGLGYSYPYDGHLLHSAYVPPGYVFFIYPFHYIAQEDLRFAFLSITQNILSCICIIPLYNYCKKRFGKETAIVCILLYALLPEMAYAALTVGPTIIFHLLIISLFLTFENTDSKEKSVIIGVIIALIIYFRSEFVLFVLLYSAYRIYNKETKHLLIIWIIIIGLISPWIIRNYLIFERFVPISTSGGLNFCRGHNIYGPGSWPGIENKELFNKLIKISTAEPAIFDIYYDQAWKYIVKHPLEEIKYSIQKVFQFWIFDWKDLRSLHIGYLFPWIFILLMGILGIVKSFKKSKYVYEYLFFCYFTFVIILFFSLVRYQILMKIMWLPFAAHGIALLLKKWKIGFPIIFRN